MLDRWLQSIGKAQFVWNFDLFKNCSMMNCSHIECRKELIGRRVSHTEGSAARRCGSAKRVFENNQQCEALAIISKSRVPKNVKQQAIRLFENRMQN